MGAYLKPLTAYCGAIGLAASVRCDPGEFVHDFFASRLKDQNYLKSWIESGTRLRRWLRNGLHLYSHERRRSFAKDRVAGHDESNEPSQTTQEAEQLFERTWALAALELAMSETKADLEKRGRMVEWEIFWAHHIEGVAYAPLGERFGLTSGQAGQRAFAVAESLRNALAVVLRQDGAIGSELDAEVRAMMEALGGR